ncbi:TPA: hypothetical protein ACH3X2_010490 [Trebouxia sp. C0005]
MPHTWRSAERSAAKEFARSLGQEHLEIARAFHNTPHASADDIVDHLVNRREELSRLATVFEFRKKDIVAFFRNRVPATDLDVGVLTNTPVPALHNILYSYLTKGWRENARALLKEDAQQREDDANGLQREWSRMRNISFSSAARAQAQGLLLRLNEAELQKLRQRLDIADADFADNKEAQVQAILSVVHRQGGPYRLLRLMADRHVRMFLSQHWEQIAEINNPEASGYDTDPIDYDMQTCQLFILWSWAHI